MKSLMHSAFYKLLTQLPLSSGKLSVQGFSFELKTKLNCYKITANIDSNYMGCIVKNRYPLAGETHLRGRDLADGTFCKKTWNRIVRDIKATESDKAL
ncbi:MAG: hypothetical protein QM813_10870 [Verrucomicrobiota bacterium]